MSSDAAPNRQLFQRHNRRWLPSSPQSCHEYRKLPKAKQIEASNSEQAVVTPACEAPNFLSPISSISIRPPTRPATRTARWRRPGVRWLIRNGGRNAATPAFRKRREGKERKKAKSGEGEITFTPSLFLGYFGRTRPTTKMHFGADRYTYLNAIYRRRSLQLFTHYLVCTGADSTVTNGRTTKRESNICRRCSERYRQGGWVTLPNYYDKTLA